MKKSWFNYLFQDMYVHHYIHSNMISQQYHRIHHIPGHNLYMERTTRCYQRKNQLKNWTKTIKNDSRRLWGFPALYYSHISYNINGTKLPGSGKYKVNNIDRKIYHRVFKLQRVTSRHSNRI